MRALLPGLTLAAVIALAAPAAHAKDLRNRFGVGFTNQLGTIPTLSARYGLPMPDQVINLQLEVMAGFALTGDDSSTASVDETGQSITAGARLLYGLVAEDNMNMYAAAGVGWVSSGSDMGLLVQPGFSVQFFLFGLENLGFSADFGVSIDLGTTSGMTTFAAAPGLGLHYFF